MMEIPDYFARKASRQFGDAGPGWVRELPALLSRCQQRWHLTKCRPIDHLSINLVCYAESPVHGDVVLKIQGPHSERLTEMKALQLYNGRHACRCLEFAWDVPAMLLERLLPGDDLRSLPSRDDQLRVGAELVVALPMPLQQTHGLPHYRDWLSTAFSTLDRTCEPDATMKGLMAAAWRLFLDIDRPQAGQFLLHGDLHHANILRTADDEWKIIDPQGVVGPAFLECGRFIENHVLRDDGDVDSAETGRAISLVADRLQQPPRTIATALFVLHLLSVCWGFEMNYARDRLACGIRQCVELLRIVDEV